MARMTLNGRPITGRATFFAVVALVGIVWLPQPATAETNLGGGVLTGDVSFSNAVPAVNTPCQQTNFTFNISGVAAVSTKSGTAWAGPILAAEDDSNNTGITGSGGSACENATAGGGSLTVNPFRARNPVNTQDFSCTQLTGQYVRTLTDVTIVVAGQCTIVGAASGKVAFIVRGEFFPTNEGGGLRAPVSAAAFVGSFQLVPADAV